jgi:protein involved in polysaccharide export with SLBB domain
MSFPGSCITGSSRARPARATRSALALAAAVVLAAALGGCASSRGLIVKREVTLPFNEEQRQSLQTATAMPYRIQRGDLMSIHFLYSENYKQPEVTVLPDGSSSFIGLDRVPVAGLTVDQLDSLLTARYSQFIRDPDLTVVVDKSVGRQVYVLGEVKTPGIFNLPVGGAGLLGAVALAGGFTDQAAKGSVVLLRVTPDGYICREVDLAAMASGRNVASALFDLQAYDVVLVPRTAIGDFAVFARDFAASMLSFTRLVFDLRGMSDTRYLVR